VIAGGAAPAPHREAMKKARRSAGFLLEAQNLIRP
jgi:hypothetical protein